MQRNYNFIYSKLVENENDIVGHIAYSLYKTQKIQHIEDFKAKNGNDPLDQDLVHFNDFSSNKSSLESYKLKAEIILQEFLNKALEETFAEMEEDITRKQSDLLKEIIAPIKPPGWWSQFWSGLGQNILSGIVITLIIALLIVVNQAKDRGVMDILTDLFNHETKKDISDNKDKPENTSVKP